MAAANKAFRIGLVIGSQRVVRVGPQVADFILETLNTHEVTQSTNKTRPKVTFDRIDLAEQNLPMFDEPAIPQHIKSADEYTNQHTRTWSRRIAAVDGLVFLSAQRNWGIPAELKNAIDYLYHEWKGKPALLITYGGHGGLQCAEQLRSVIGAMGMRPLESQVSMSFPDRDFRERAFRGEHLGLAAGSDSSPWAGHRKEFVAAHDNLIDALLTVRATTDQGL